MATTTSPGSLQININGYDGGNRSKRNELVRFSCFLPPGVIFIAPRSMLRSAAAASAGGLPLPGVSVPPMQALQRIFPLTMAVLVAAAAVLVVLRWMSLV